MTARGLSAPARVPVGALLGRSARDAVRSPAQARRWWQAMETAITLSIILLVVLSAADSVDAANWVGNMPDLRLLGVLAVLAAAALAASPVHWLPALLGGIGIGTIFVVWQVLSLDQFDGLPWFWERFGDLRLRLAAWFREAFNDGITTDNVPFTLFVTGSIWLATFPSTWLALRQRTPWPLIVVLGVVLTVNVSYLDASQWDVHFAFFAAGAALLVMRTSLLRRMARWQQRGTAFPDFISLSFLAVTLLAVVGLMTVSRLAPRPDEAEPLNQLWGSLTVPFEDLSDELERLFGGVHSGGPSPVHNFGANLVLQGEILPGRTVVARVDAPEDGLLRGASYDRYTTRGWQQSGVEPSPAAAGEDFGGSEARPYAARREVRVGLALVDRPRVLFSFGSPDAVNRDVIVEQTAPSRVRLEAASGAAGGVPPELAGLAGRLAQGAGEQAVAGLPPDYVVTGLDPDRSGLLRSVDLESRAVPPDVVVVRPEAEASGDFRYTVGGTVSSATVEQLRAAGRDYPLWARERFLQLPLDLSNADLQRLREVAARTTAGAASAYDAAALLEGLLCCTPALDADGAPLLGADGSVRPLYPFVTEIASPPPGVDGVSWWLLDYTGADGLPVGGYYDYHASAMAVLLRTLGIPARISTGFVLSADNFDAASNNYIVRVEHAYSWVEVYFPAYGWVDFDPTPPTTGEEFDAIAGERIAEQRLRPPEPEPAVAEAEAEAAEPAAEEPPPPEAGAARQADSAAGFDLWLVLWPLIGLAALLAAGGGGLLAWRFSLRGLTPVERAWTSAQRLARVGGLRVDAACTPREYGADLGRALRDPDAAAVLAAAYTRERFRSGTLASPEVGAASRAWRSLRGRLWRRVLRLPLPASPAWDADGFTGDGGKPGSSGGGAEAPEGGRAGRAARRGS